MKVEFKDTFSKNFKKRFRNNITIQSRFKKRLHLFSINPLNPLLHDHVLMGDLKGYRAFSISGDIRVLYYVWNDTAYFVDIGTHNQVY